MTEDFTQISTHRTHCSWQTPMDQCWTWTRGTLGLWTLEGHVHCDSFPLLDVEREFKGTYFKHTVSGFANFSTQATFGLMVFLRVGNACNTFGFQTSWGSLSMMLQRLSLIQQNPRMQHICSVRLGAICLQKCCWFQGAWEDGMIESGETYDAMFGGESPSMVLDEAFSWQLHWLEWKQLERNVCFDMADGWFPA